MSEVDTANQLKENHSKLISPPLISLKVFQSYITFLQTFKITYTNIDS